MVSSPIVYAVDDDPLVLGLIRAVARAEKFTLQTFDSPTDFLTAYEADRKGCLLLDYHLPEMTGLDVLRELSSVLSAKTFCSFVREYSPRGRVKNVQVKTVSR